MHWRREFDDHPGPPRAGADGTVRIAHRGPAGHTITQVGPDGSVLRSVTPEQQSHERLDAFVVLPDVSQAHRPMSVGVRLRNGEAEAEVVLCAGGWVDADCLPAGEQDVICEYVEVDHADEAGPLLDRVVAALTDT